jgi:H+/Cl- antiporter ClcA
MESESVGVICTPALLPCFLSAFVASQASLVLGVHPETYFLETALPITMTITLKIAALSILIALLGIAMCYAFHHAEHLGKKWIPNAYLRIAVGGCVIAVMTFLAGDHRFNGAGMDMALDAVTGNSNWYNFALKLLFTAITLAAGFKGGEIVPTFCIGATFGCFIGPLLGLDPGVSAAIGLVGLFCCATNSPLTAILLSIEMFGSRNLYLFAWVCVITFVLSGHSSLYTSQIIRYHKTSTEGSHGRE